MASKQATVKTKQGYVAKAIPETCANCQHILSDRVMTRAPTTWNPEGYYEEKNIRCGIGGFPVKKMGSCNEFELKEGK